MTAGTADVDTARIFVLADKIMWLPGVAVRIVDPAHLGPCTACADDACSCCEPIPATAYVCTRTRDDAEPWRQPVCAGCLTRVVRDRITSGLRTWVEIPAVVTEP